MRLLHTFALAAAVFTASCASLQSMLPSHRAAEERATQLQELQLKVMRFADEYAGRVQEQIRILQATAKTPEERLAAQNWRLSQSTSAYTIASGPNSITNALDMVVLATLSRMVVEDHWVSQVYGDRATALLDTHRQLESQAWTLLDGILNADQFHQLRVIINTWRAEHPKVLAVSYIHFRDFAMSIGQSGATGSGSLFALLGLDPLSNLDPAVREITQTRQLAERTIYYMQHVPNLLDMQIERLTYQLAVTPETKQLLLDADRISLAAESTGRLADGLPHIIASEREAAIDQFMAALNTQQAQVSRLVVDLRGALEAAATTSDSLNTTIRSLDAFVARFDKPAATSAKAPPARPFDIADYTATAHELASAARELQALLAQIDSSSSGVERLTASAASDLHLVVDHAFWRSVQLILILVAAVLGAVLIYRFAVARLAARAR